MHFSARKIVQAGAVKGLRSVLFDNAYVRQAF